MELYSKYMFCGFLRFILYIYFQFLSSSRDEDVQSALPAAGGGRRRRREGQARRHPDLPPRGQDLFLFIFLFVNIIFLKYLFPVAGERRAVGAG